MIEIHSVKDYNIIKDLSVRYGFEVDTNEVLAVFDNNEILEFAVYTHNSDNNDIVFISDNNNDFTLIHGLIKTLIFLSDLKTAKTLTMPLDYVRVAKAIGFKQIDNKYVLKLDEYQNTCESSGKDN